MSREGRQRRPPDRAASETLPGATMPQHRFRAAAVPPVQQPGPAVRERSNGAAAPRRNDVSSHPHQDGGAKASSTARLVGVLVGVLLVGGLAGLYIWMTLNDVLEGRAHAKQLWLALAALAGLLALLGWFKSFLECWQDGQ